MATIDAGSLVAAIRAANPVTVEVLGPLFSLLTADDRATRIGAAEAMSTLDPAAPGASWRREALAAHAAAIVARLTDTEPRVRTAACLALGKLEPQALMDHYTTIAQNIAAETDEAVREAAASTGFTFASVPVLREPARPS